MGLSSLPCTGGCVGAVHTAKTARPVRLASTTCSANITSISSCRVTITCSNAVTTRGFATWFRVAVARRCIAVRACDRTRAFASEHHFVRPDVEPDGIVLAAVGLDELGARSLRTAAHRMGFAHRAAMDRSRHRSVVCVRSAGQHSTHARGRLGVASVIAGIVARRRRARSDILRAT